MRGREIGSQAKIQQMFFQALRVNMWNCTSRVKLMSKSAKIDIQKYATPVFYVITL